MLELGEGLPRVLPEGISPFILSWWEERRERNLIALARGGLCILTELCVLLEVLFDTGVGSSSVPTRRAGGFLQCIAKSWQD